MEKKNQFKQPDKISDRQIVAGGFNQLRKYGSASGGASHLAQP
jgi:hypothetical protein